MCMCVASVCVVCECVCVCRQTAYAASRTTMWQPKVTSGIVGEVAGCCFPEHGFFKLG